MTVLRGFQDFPEEAVLIGRMLAGYADLEIDLMNCVTAARGDLDLSLKTMFRGRGNSQRIDIADALGRPPYAALGLDAKFEAAIAAVRYCLRIRNLYAHSNWWNDNTGQLAFANLEELAKEDVVVTDLRGLTVRHVSIPHLRNQLAYFDFADDSLIGVIQEGNRRAGRPAFSNLHIPPNRPQPQIYL